MTKLAVYFLFVFPQIMGFIDVQLKPYKCDFENGICIFLSNDGVNSVNWRIGKGKVKAGDTGPTIDHTKGTSNGSYIFVDVSNASVGSVKLLTEALKADYCVGFSYHMYGADIGDLSVYAKSVYGSENVRYFYRERSQGDRWKQARFSVSQTANMRYKGYRISFVAKGRSYSGLWGDIALDDLDLIPGKCNDTKQDAYDVCSFNDYNCGYTSSRMSSMQWEWKNNHTTSNYFSNQPSEDHTLGTSIGGYWFVGDKGYSSSKLDTVMLSSPVYDKPKTSLNCLHFYVYLDHEASSMWWGGVKENFIQVFVNFPDSKDARKWIVTQAKNTTESAKWVYVEAKVELTQKFQIQFIAGLQTPVESIAALDDVKLIAGICPEAGFCDFEQSKCSWSDGEGDYNWIRKSPSSRNNIEIGPDEDNTLKTSEGNYMVFNTRNKKASSTASLESEYFPPGQASYCISFYYYMKGADLGTLKVNVKQDNITEASVWILKGEQGDRWSQGKAILKPSLMYTRVVFQGITGKGTNAYMALDDIRIRQGETCNLTPATADPRYEETEKLTCTFDDLNLCSWKQDTETLSWKFGNGSQFDSTGPEEPLNGKGHYLFISSYEGGQSNNEKVARIISPSVSSFYPESACFSFYYHMFGAHVGHLRVALVLIKDTTTPIVIWRRLGTQPDKWIQFNNSLNVTAGEYRIEIEAEGGSGFAGDIAIDNILLSIGACPNTDLCDFESNMCGWRVEGNKNDTYYWKRGVKMTNGPPNDHTTITEAGYYLQAVSKNESKTEDKTNLLSPIYNSRWGPHCLTFWYWRPGYGVGKLSVLTRINGVEKLQWQVTSDVGKNWHFGQVTIFEEKKLQLIIQAQRGINNAHQMAIDDILIKNSECGHLANCNFNKDYCSYSQNATSDFAWLLGTGRVVNSQLIENPPEDNSVHNGMYAYADMTSPSLKPGHKAILSSEILLGSVYKVACVTFYYYIGGGENSTLVLGKMLLNNSKQVMQYMYKDIFTINYNTGKLWRTRAQNIAVTAGERFQVYFKATKENGSKAFIAIDDITVVNRECLLCDCGDGGCEMDANGTPIPCVCDGKLKEYHGKCKVCDCGDGHCELDTNGTPIPCVCDGKLKEYDRKCKVCDCGDGQCDLDVNGTQKPCVCDGKLKEYNGKCKVCDCGYGQCDLDVNGIQKHCICGGKLKEYNGKCKVCDCGDGECELGANGSPKPCVCDGKLKEYNGTCKMCDCGDGECELGANGSPKPCVCDGKLKKFNGTCKKCFCGKQSKLCFFHDHGQKYCVCKEGYAQRNGTCRATCNWSGECLNNGTCVYEEGSYFCNCHEDFEGDKCEINEGCKPIENACEAMNAKCKYLTWLKKAFCVCPPSTQYDWNVNYCVEKSSSLVFITMCIASGLLLVSTLTLVIVFRKFRSKINTK